MESLLAIALGALPILGAVFIMIHGAFREARLAASSKRFKVAYRTLAIVLVDRKVPGQREELFPFFAVVKKFRSLETCVCGALSSARSIIHWRRNCRD